MIALEDPLPFVPLFEAAGAVIEISALIEDPPLLIDFSNGMSATIHSETLLVLPQTVKTTRITGRDWITLSRGDDRLELMADYDTKPFFRAQATSRDFAAMVLMFAEVMALELESYDHS